MSVDYQQELDRQLAHSSADPSLVRKVARLRRNAETWCVLAGRARNGDIRDALGLLDPKLANLVQDGDTFQYGIHYGRDIEFEYGVNTALSTDAEAMPLSPAQPLGGPQMKESSLLPVADTARDRGSAHEVVKISRARYDTWLAGIQAQAHAGVATTHRDDESLMNR